MCTLHEEESWCVGIAWGGVPVCMLHREGA